MVNHPPHYRGPSILIHGFDATGGKSDFFKRIDCIEIIRHITDMRLANAIKYIWRVAFGGKDNDREDIEKAIWYLNDWLENEVEAK